MAQLMSIKRNVEMCPGQVSVPAIYHVSQGDKGTRIILGLVNNSANYTIPEGTTATIRGHRADGTLFTEITADVETTEVKFNLTEDMSAIPGRAECEAVLASGSANIIGTANFIIDVEKSPASIGSVFPGTDAATTWLIDELTNLDLSSLDDESVVDAINSKANESTIAPEFDSSASYTAGQMVLKNGVLYRFTQAHTGAWTGTDAVETTVEAEIKRESATDEQVQTAVDNWLDEHPEATTTVEDFSLTANKLVKGTLGFVTPEMYEAKGDGLTDDTSAISQAFASGLNVQFKNGATYNISGALTITNPIVIYGNGATIKQTSSRTNAIVASGVSNITISDLCIIGYGNDYVGQGGQIAPYGIKISGTSENHVSNIVIQNCIVKYCTWCGIDVSYADNVVIDGNTVVGTGVQDLEYESNYQFGITFGYGTDIKVLGNTVSETAQGLYIGQKLKNAVVSNNVIKDIRGQHGCYATSGTNFEFSNNVLTNIAIEGIKMQLDVNTEENAKNGIIAFNVFSGTGSFAIHTVNLTDNGYVVENYTINDNVIDNSGGGVYVTNGKDIVVKNNTIVNSNYGIRFRYMSAGSLILENNFIKNIQNNGIAQYSNDTTEVKDLIIKNNVLKECGQVGTASSNAVTIRLNYLAVTGKFIFDGNHISDDNNLSYQTGSINGQFSEGLVFINNHIRNKSIYIGADLREFNNNVCEGGLTIAASKYAGRKTRVYTGTVSDLPANTSGYSNGDMFYFTDVATSGYAMAVLQDGAWAMLGKLDDYVIHPFTDTHSASRCTINSVSITSSGDELTISMSITVLVRGTETVIGNFKAKSSLLPSAKTEIYANNISVYLTALGYLSMYGGVVNTTYDFTVKLVNGVLQSS